MDTSKETFKAFQQDDVLSTADVVSNVIIKPEEEYAYGFIIEVLTSGLYPDVFHVIREYVQNSFDAIIAWCPKSGLMDICLREKGTILSKLNNNKFLNAIEQGIILIDIDVTDKYNHGTIFRIKGKELTALYEEQTDLIPQRYNATLTN